MNVPEGWAEPPEEIKDMAVNLFQMFTALCGAGFTEQQALSVVGQIIQGARS
jgi:hypothetical protein